MPGSRGIDGALVRIAAFVLAAGVGLAAGADDTRLADASESQDSEAVAALLAQGADVNAPQPDGATALHWAAHWDDVPTANDLISAGASANATNDYGVTPLFLAAGNGSAAMVEAVLDAGGDPRAALPSGETVLMTAVRSGSVRAVARLLASGADPNATQRSKSQTALMWAATRQRVDIVRALLDRGADVHLHSASGFTPLMFAAREGSIEVSRLLLAAGDDVNATSADGSTPLFVATIRGHAELAMFLLEQGAEPDGNLEGTGYTPLHWASSTGETPLTYGGIEAPGEWRAIPGVPDREAKLTLIQALIEHGADIEAKISRGMLAYSTFENRSRRGGTPFFTATASGDAEVMRLLLAYGADPLTRAGGWTPLMAAAGAMGNQLPNVDDALVVTELDRLEAVELAWKLGSDLEAEERQGYRALHVAASAGFHEIIAWLVETGADVNAKSKDRVENVFGRDVMVPGQTPLGVAEGYLAGTLWVRPETAEFLRGLGAISEGKVNLENYVERQSQDPPEK